MKTGKDSIDHSHPYYGPDSFAVAPPPREPPRKPGFWGKLRTWFRSR